MGKNYFVVRLRLKFIYHILPSYILNFIFYFLIPRWDTQIVWENSSLKFVIVQSFVQKCVVDGLMQGKGSSHEKVRGCAWSYRGNKQGEGSEGCENHHGTNSDPTEEH